MSPILERPVSLFAHVQARIPTSNPPLAEVLAQIKDGASAKRIAELRDAKPRLLEKAYKAEKAKLRCFTPCCTLRTRDRHVGVNDRILSCTGLVHLDFDHLEDLAATREHLLKEPSLVFCFVSPSGDGLKAGFATTGIMDGDTYKHVWRHVVELLEARYPGLEASRDPAISYINALCYLSHDPDLFMNEQAVPIEIAPYGRTPEVPEPEPAPEQEHEKETEPREGPPPAVVASALFSLGCYDDYKTWVRVGMALHSTGHPGAFGLWAAWSSQSTKYDPQVLPAKWKSFHRDGDVQIDNLFTMARKAGWQDSGITSYQNSNYLVDNSTRLGKVSCGEEAPQAITSFTSLQEWPTLADEAFHGVVGEIVRTISPHTEADPVALLIQLLTYFGVVIGRRAYHMVGATRHHTNLSTCLVGATSRGRKGSAFDFVQACVFPPDPGSFVWSDDNIIGGCGSGEGVIYAVRDPVYKAERVKEKGEAPRYELVEVDPGVTDKRLLIHEAEFSSVLKVTSREGNLLSEVLRKAWETGTLRNAVKTAPLKATGAHISLIGHISSEELQKTLTTTEAANGFANRILWVCVRRHGRLPEGGSLDARTMEHLRTRFREAVRNTQHVREMTRDKGARQAWDAVWDALTDDRPGLVGSLLARSEAQTLRLSMLYALLDGSAVIRHDHLNAALALWQYVEQSVWYIFGTTLGDVAADTVLAALDQAKGGLSRNYLLTKTLHGNYRADELDRVLRLLQRLGLATISQQKTGGRGRPTELITRLPNEVNEVNTNDYVSMSNKAVKSMELPNEVIPRPYEVNPQNGSEPPIEPPFVPDMTGVPPDWVTDDFPDNGDKIPDAVPMREPGEDDDFEEGLL